MSLDKSTVFVPVDLDVALGCNYMKSLEFMKKFEVAPHILKSLKNKVQKRQSTLDLIVIVHTFIIVFIFVGFDLLDKYLFPIFQVGTGMIIVLIYRILRMVIEKYTLEIFVKRINCYLD